MSDKQSSSGHKSDENFDYSKCQCELRLYKQAFIGKDHRYAYITQNSLVICKEPYQKIPDKIISLSSDMRIKWLFDTQKENLPFPKKVVGFHIFNPKNPNDVSYEYLGEPVVIVTLRDYIGRIIFQSDFLKEFDIKLKLGQGQYAQVYEVLNQETKQQFAVQYLHQAQLATIEDGIDSLHNELQILRKLDHKNIIKFLTAYQDENGFYILTDLLNGEKTLQHEISKHQNGGMKFSSIRQIMRELLQALEYIHSLGIMHRDLKPQNIMFAQDSKDENDNDVQGVLQVIDFGLSQIVKEQRYIYVHVGTPGYVAPEILANESENHRYTEQCDIFSAGVIFHILMTGKAVFPGKKFSQVFKANKLCKISLIGPKYDDLDSVSIDLMNKLLEANPLKRLSAGQALQHPFFSQSFTLPPAGSKKDINSLMQESSSPLIKYRKSSIQMTGLGQDELTRARVISLKDMDKHIQKVTDMILKFQPLVQISKRKSKEEKRTFYNFTHKLVNLFWKIEEGCNLSELAGSPLKKRQTSITNHITQGERSQSPSVRDHTETSISSPGQRNSTLKYTLSPGKSSSHQGSPSLSPIGSLRDTGLQSEKKSITLTRIHSDVDPSDPINGAQKDQIKEEEEMKENFSLNNQSPETSDGVRQGLKKKPMPIITKKQKESPSSPSPLGSNDINQEDLYSPGLKQKSNSGNEESKDGSSPLSLIGGPQTLYRVDLFQQANTVSLELDCLRPYFPAELFYTFDESDDEVVKEQRCRIIATFLIFGVMDSEKYDDFKKLGDMKLLVYEKEDPEFYDLFFLDLLKSMLEQDQQKIPNFQQIQYTLENNIPHEHLS